MISRTILESIGDAIYGLGPDWSISFFNAEAERFFGRSRKEVIGRILWEAFPAALGSELEIPLREVMESRTALNQVILSPTTGRWADTRIFPLENGGLSVSWRDVTAQRRQEAELAEAIREQSRLLRELQTITDHIPAMIASWDLNLKCRFANARYLEWFGRTSEQMLGLSIQELMGEALFAQNEPYIRRALAGERLGFERTLQKTSGEIGHTWAQYIPDTDRDGRVIGFYALVTDVSPIKKTEELLRMANSELELARAEAEALAAVKSDFLSNMSHELRNPLTSIIGYAELLAGRATLTGSDRKYVSRMLEAGEALLTTVNDVLDFSKLEAGQVEIERRPNDPTAIGLSALEMFELQMEKKHLVHRFEAVEVPAQVLVDDVRLRQILTNLIGNAVKFTAAGSVILRCRYDAARQSLRFEVIDTGPGIPDELQSRLFQRFSQVNASTVRNYGGTGLGLAICKGLAEAMGGKIGVSSAPGKGSCFWFELPCAPVEPETETGHDPGDILQDQDALRGLQLLVVDDNQVNRELVRALVEPLGVVVAEADSGSDAVLAAQRAAFDAILMDIHMPGIDGFAAAKIIRDTSEQNARTPIFAFTADAPDEMPGIWKALLDGIVSKPIGFAHLIRLLADRHLVSGA